MLARRQLFFAAGAAFAAPAKLSRKERVDRALAGQEVDRPPFSFWHHFLDEKEPAEVHARNTLRFAAAYRTDLVKVMSDYPFPKPAGHWYEVKPLANPFPAQIAALEKIRAEAGGYFVETIFNPWNVAEKLSSPQAVKQLMADEPQRLLDALEAIAKSEAAHAKKAVAAGAAGVFLAVANAQAGILTEAEYQKFSEPFDRMVLDAVPSARLNILHAHGDKVYLDRFLKGWPVAVVNYSLHGTGIPLAEARKKSGLVLMGGIDERSYHRAAPEAVKQQIAAARAAAGAKFILSPGCSVDNHTPEAQLRVLPDALGA
jgi:uroporphyrinogen decarboxylase